MKYQTHNSMRRLPRTIAPDSRRAWYLNFR